MELLVTDGIDINLENSQKYNGIFINGGAFSGLNVSGSFEPVIANFTCTLIGRHNVQVYVNPKSGYVTLEERPVALSCIPESFHIGGLDIDCDACGNYKIIDLLLPENPCIAYARPFSSAFSITGKGADNNFGDFNKIQAQYDICSIIAGEAEFNSDYNCDYAIQGTTLPCPEEFALFAGNSALYVGVDGQLESGLYDGNTPNPNPIPIN